MSDYIELYGQQRLVAKSAVEQIYVQQIGDQRFALKVVLRSGTELYLTRKDLSLEVAKEALQQFLE